MCCPEHAVARRLLIIDTGSRGAPSMAMARVVLASRRLQLRIASRSDQDGRKLGSLAWTTAHLSPIYVELVKDLGFSAV